MSRITVSVFLAAFTVLPHLAEAITIPTVPVGNAGNLSDTQGMNDGTFGYGSVPYDYRISTYEVTNSQYAAFLNAKATSDPLGLYNAAMGDVVYGGITRSGVSGSYVYAVKVDLGNKPVNYVSWFDAARFANWLHNGQGNGGTESGAYLLEGGTPTPSNAGSIAREAGATWFLTSENEWYKAAFHQPAAQGGDVDDYWLYPTASNVEPTVAIGDAVGDITNAGANVVNCTFGDLTTVGSAGPLSQSFYGTSDQGGNVWEWNEGIPFDTFRGIRGSGIYDDVAKTRSLLRASAPPTSEENNIGFRVATTVPEPSSIALAAVALVGLIALNRRKVVTPVA